LRHQTFLETGIEYSLQTEMYSFVCKGFILVFFRRSLFGFVPFEEVPIAVRPVSPPPIVPPPAVPPPAPALERLINFLATNRVSKLHN
jgi:hypothetical protein